VIPAAFGHVVGADHDFVEVFYAKAGVVEARDAAGSWRLIVEQEGIVVLVGTVRSQVGADAFL